MDDREHQLGKHVYRRVHHWRGRRFVVRCETYTILILGNDSLVGLKPISMQPLNFTVEVGMIEQFKFVENHDG